MSKLILASQSPYRKKQMQDFGLHFETLSPDLDEKAYQLKIKNPTKLALELSYQKAFKVQEKFPDDIIIGSDQLVAFDGKILGKPGSKDAAKSQLRMLSGKSHKLITAVTILSHRKRLSAVVVAKIRMRKLTENEISIYVDKDKPYDCAGSYRFEAGAYSLIEKLDVDDPSSLMGLPMITLGKMLRKISKSEHLTQYFA